MASRTDPFPSPDSSEVSTPSEGGDRRLHDVMIALDERADESVVLERISTACCELVGADAAAFIVERADQLSVVGAVGITGPVGGLITKDGYDDIRRQIEASGRTVVPDIQAPGLLDATARLATGSLHTTAITAVRSGDEIRGVLCALYAEPDRPLDPGDLTMLGLLATTAGAAITNADAFSALAGREAREAAIIDSLASGIAVVDPDDVVVEWNSSAERLTGIGRSNALGQIFPVSIGDPENPTEHDFGEDRWLEIAATALPGSDDRVIVLHDISRQKALEAAKIMFLASTSHELKTPLMAIGGFARWLADRPPPAEDGERHDTAVSGIIAGVDELTKLVEKVLLNARTEAGRLDLTPRTIDLRRALPAIVDQFDMVSDDVRFEIDVAPSVPDVVADGEAFQTILGQLIENAIKYSPNGGTLRIGARGLSDSPGLVEISVADEGIGLTESEAEYLFMPFYQGETRRSSGVSGGVGLGLAIVRRLVEAHGGTVYAGARPERGSVFAFTLPVASPQDLS